MLLQTRAVSFECADSGEKAVDVEDQDSVNGLES